MHPAATRPRILIVEDEPSIADNILYSLESEGFAPCACGTGAEAVARLTNENFALVVLDVGLPDTTGFEVCKQMRAVKDVPVIFLTARDSTEEKIHGLTIGGDDYVTKPFSLEELIARVRVVLRRHSNGASEREQLRLADLELDDEAHEVRRAGQPIETTPTEYRLLRYLLINAGRVLTRSQILDHVWNYDFGGDASVLETYISYLRRKVDKFDPPLIHTVRSVGYVMRAPRP